MNAMKYVGKHLTLQKHGVVKVVSAHPRPGNRLSIRFVLDSSATLTETFSLLELTAARARFCASPAASLKGRAP